MTLAAIKSGPEQGPQDFLELNDFSAEELSSMLETARRYKASPSLLHDMFRGQSLRLIFDKRSVRTHDSFATGFALLGGTPVTSDLVSLGLGKKESLEDIAQTLSQYFCGIVIRASDPELVRELAHYADIPVINAMTDNSHPCQGMADVMTMQEQFGTSDLRGKKVVFAGDYVNNVARTHMDAARIFGYDLVVSGPEHLQDQLTLPGHVKFDADLKRAARNADVIMTDVWTSMGQDGKDEAAFRPYQVSGDIMKLGSPRAIFMHCMPVSPCYQKEVTREVRDSGQCAIIQQAGNRKSAQIGVMLHCLR